MFLFSVIYLEIRIFDFGPWKGASDGPKFPKMKKISWNHSIGGNNIDKTDELFQRVYSGRIERTWAGLNSKIHEKSKFNN